MALRRDDDVPAPLGIFTPGWHPGWTPATWQREGLPARGWTATVAMDQQAPLDVERAPMYLIDLQPWDLRHVSRWQIWSDRNMPLWQCALKRHMGSPAAALVVVRKLWHARGELHSDDLMGLVSVLPLGGSAVLHDGRYEVPLPRATTVAFAGRVPAARVLAAAAVEWRGLVETRVWTTLVMTTRE